MSCPDLGIITYLFVWWDLSIQLLSAFVKGISFLQNVFMVFMVTE
jgi:hypothetical protein